MYLDPPIHVSNTTTIFTYDTWITCFIGTNMNPEKSVNYSEYFCL